MSKMFFPSKTELLRVACSRPHYSLDAALDTMATEFEVRANELNATEEERVGQLFVFGKRIGEDFEFEFKVADGYVYFRETEDGVWGSYSSLCDGKFDLFITRAVFVEAVHSALWWQLYYVAQMRVLERVA